MDILSTKVKSIALGGSGGSGLDMEALSNEFASKNLPDNTIVRIEALENALKQQGSLPTSSL